MKKFLIPILFCLVSIMTSAQAKIAEYSSGSYLIIIDTSASHRSTVFAEICSQLGLHGCTLDSITIEDQDPSTIDSAAYIVFHYTCSGVSHSLGFYLTKGSVGGKTHYYIDDDSSSIAKAWKCETAGECNVCKPDRNWFLGPVIGCECSECKFSTSGGGIPWDAIGGIIGVILTLLF